jgi:hypothetical protein
MEELMAVGRVNSAAKSVTNFDQHAETAIASRSVVITDRSRSGWMVGTNNERGRYRSRVK